MSPAGLPAIGPASPAAIDSPEDCSAGSSDENRGDNKPDFTHPPQDNRPRIRLNSKPARVVGSFDHPVLPMPPVCIMSFFHTERLH